MVAILFVCYANVCRSPAAAAILQHLAKQKGLDRQVKIDSCGITDDRIGGPPDPEMIEALVERGVYLAGNAKIFKMAYFKEFDYILAADRQVLSVLRYRARAPEDLAKIHLMSDFAPSLKGSEIPDPYVFTSSFPQVRDLLFSCCEHLLEHLAKKLE